MENSEAIKLAWRVFVEHPTSNEQVLETALAEAGIPQPLVYLASEFMPLAFGRILLAEMGVTLRDEYVRYIWEEGKMVERERKKLADEPFFVEALKIARSKRGWWNPGKKFLAVAARSAEFNAVTEMVKRGSRAENVVLTVPYLQFRESPGKPE
jgi:hypothetical protein